MYGSRLFDFEGHRHGKLAVNLFPKVNGRFPNGHGFDYPQGLDSVLRLSRNTLAYSGIGNAAIFVDNEANGNGMGTFVSLGNNQTPIEKGKQGIFSTRKLRLKLNSFVNLFPTISNNTVATGEFVLSAQEKKGK
jgi:hypothetical protein